MTGTMADLAATTGIDVPTGLLIGGQWTKGRDGGLIGVTDPATEETIAEVADATAEDTLDAVSAASAALPGWAATAPRERAECLRRAWSLMIARSDALARLMVLENGKALPDARGRGDLRRRVLPLVRRGGGPGRGLGAHRALRRQPHPRHPAAGRRQRPHHPVELPGRDGHPEDRPALAAGCTVVLKPAKETPLTALAVADILREAGVPDGVVNVVTTSSASRFSETVLADPRVRKLSFTGSTEVGRVLLKAAANSVINCSMELGGNAPFLIFEDADISAALDGAFLAKMRNGGEACTAANRFYVHEAVADEFTAAFAARLGALKVGPGLDEGTELGPLVNEDTRSKVASLVDEATGAGSRVVTGGSAPDRRGYFYAPTVLDNVPPGAGILDEEIFGPVAPIVRFSSESDAVSWANNTEYGLVSYVYTRDLRRSLRVAEALEAGMIGINRGVVSDPAAPFGGVKQSGIGREGGHDGLLEFTETKYIAVNW